jgi:type II secretory pathway pseudopilin PulG
LVVIAIISILAAMLLPALKTAKASAQAVYCANNLQGVGKMTVMYISDYNDWFPGGGPTTSNPSEYKWYNFTGGNTYAITMEYQLEVYTETLHRQSNTFWICPTVTSSSGNYYDNDLRTPPHHQYGINWHMISPSGGGKTYRARQIRDPSGTLYYMDSDSPVNFCSGCLPRFMINFSFMPIISRRHIGGANVLWSDFRVTRLKATDPIAWGNGVNWDTSPGWKMD